MLSYQTLDTGYLILDTIRVKLLTDLNVLGKRVFVRADLDVDVGNVQHPNEVVRLRNLKRTVDYLLGQNCKQILLAGHIGRPDASTAGAGTVSERPPFYNPKFSTEQLVQPLAEIVGQEIVFCQDFGHVGEAKILLFENLRFWPGEVKKDQVFANKLSVLGDIYVNESFANCHRDHASMVLVPLVLPHAAGMHLMEEVSEMEKLLGEPARPFVAIVGGAKAETKIPVIVSLAKMADAVLVGGALLKEISRPSMQVQNVDLGSLTRDGEDMDDASIERFKAAIAGAKTVVWNGPLSHFEAGFDKASGEIANAIIQSRAYSVVGGGETTTFLAKNNLLLKFSFVSSGGGAMLEFLAGKKLSALEALE